MIDDFLIDHKVADDANALVAPGQRRFMSVLVVGHRKTDRELEAFYGGVCLRAQVIFIDDEDELGNPDDFPELIAALGRYPTETEAAEFVTMQDAAEDARRAPKIAEARRLDQADAIVKAEAKKRPGPVQRKS